MAVALGFNMRLKLILSRVEQLVKQEATDLMESKSLSVSKQTQMCVVASLDCANANQLCWHDLC